MSQAMTIGLGALGDDLLRALLHDDVERRRSAVMAWKDSVVQATQTALPGVLATYCEAALENLSKINDASRRESLTNKLSKGRSWVLQMTLTTAEKPRESQSGTAGGTNAEQPGGSVRPSGSPNDDRSDSMNPNNPAHHAAADNRSNQMNPNNPAYHSSRGHGGR